jgi:hypothetical protein
VDQQYLAALSRFAGGLVHLFGWDDWRAEGDRMVSPGGRKLPRATWERLKAKSPKEPPKKAAPSTPKAAPAKPAAKPAPAPDLNTFLKQNKPADVDPAAWRRLMGAADVRSAARWVIEHEKAPKDSDWEYDHAGRIRQIEWRLRGRKLPAELAPAAVALARLEAKHRELSGAASDVVIPPPARGKRYLGIDEFNGARYAMVNDTPAVKALRREIADLSNATGTDASLHAKAKRLGDDAYFGNFDADPVRDATDSFLSHTKPDRYGNDKWKDRAAWTPEALKAAWDEVAKPRLDQAKQYVEFAKQDWVVDAKTDPEKLVKAARDSGNYYVQKLVGHVLNRVHRVEWPHWRREEETIPTWDDVLSGKKSLTDLRAARAKEASDDTTRRDQYARESVASIKQAANLLGKIKSTHWPFLKAQLRKAGLGKIEKRGTWDYTTGRGRWVQEFVFWPKTGSAITARAVPELLSKIQVVAATLNERTVTADQLDKTTRSFGEWLSRVWR